MKTQDSDEIADIAAFHQAMRDVVPIKKKSSFVTLKKPAPSHHRSEFVRDLERDTPPTLSPSEYCSKILPDTYLFAADSSLGNKILRKFKQGQYNPEATLDLHGFTVNQAALTLDRFIQQSIHQGYRVLLVIHGKGAQAILKTQVNYWLTDHPRVLAFCSAKPKHGGVGAVYLLLKRQTSAGDHFEK